MSVEARPTVTVEGILLLAFSDVVERLDMTVFMDVQEEVRLARRIERDVAERGRDPEDVRRQFRETVAPMHDQFVQAHRDRADYIVRIGDSLDVVAAELAQSLAASRVS